MTRDYQADPLTGRPVSWRIAALDEPEPVRHGDAERRRPFAPVAPGCAPCSRSFRLRWGFAWTTRTGSDTKSPKWRINSLTRIRCRTQTSAGRHGMPATHTAVSYSNTTRRWSSPTAAEVQVLESGGVEPVHGHPQRQRRAQFAERATARYRTPTVRSRSLSVVARQHTRIL